MTSGQSLTVYPDIIMSAGLRVRHAAAARETVVVRIWRWIKITVWRVFYGQNEWQRLFQPAEVDEDERIVRFRTELGLSDTMAQTCDVVFAMKPFPMDETLRDVATRAQLDEKDVTIGTDPMSDFRGMGIFSLVQLNYFTKNYKVEAQRALEESNHPTRWYPFAVTGINVTAFLIELIDERLLDVKLYRLAANGKDDEDLNAGLTQLHDVYATIFTRFNKLWVDTNPRDVMAFPCLFQGLKNVIRAELMLASFRF
uniref:ELMO domain-containing protein n=1 Tax=Hyaloperonospora arabidopsidis (strain Emoy2) TaxID=559515 RepID=M4BY67_HYAAE